MSFLLIWFKWQLLLYRYVRCYMLKCQHTPPGAAAACGGGGGQAQLHDPPLIFDLSRDPEERFPLDPLSAEYQAALQAVRREREALLWDIANDNVSTANYITEREAAPCCNRSLPVCRCKQLCWETQDCPVTYQSIHIRYMPWHLSQTVSQIMRGFMLTYAGEFRGSKSFVVCLIVFHFI